MAYPTIPTNLVLAQSTKQITRLEPSCTSALPARRLINITAGFGNTDTMIADNLHHSRAPSAPRVLPAKRLF